MLLNDFIYCDMCDKRQTVDIRTRSADIRRYVNIKHKGRWKNFCCKECKQKWLNIANDIKIYYDPSVINK